MTQTITGSGLGIQDSSTNLGAYGAKGSTKLGQGQESVYVNASNGNFIVKQNDGFLASNGLGLELFQTYNSLAEGPSPWVFSVQSKLQVFGTLNQNDFDVIRYGEDGHQTRFIWDNQQQAYRPQTGGVASLCWQKNQWVFCEGASQTQYHYDIAGKLSQISDRNGHHLDFIYQQEQLLQIIGDNGKQKINWSFSQGLLREITTMSNGEIIHHLRYDYDAKNRLQKITRDLGLDKTYWTSYAYHGDSNRISDILEADGTSLHIDYDHQGRVKKLIDGEGRCTRYEYSDGFTKLIQDPNEEWVYFYDEQSHLTGVDGPQQYRIRYQYENNQLCQIQQGHKIWHFTYNNAGDCIEIQEPHGQVISRHYDEQHHLIAETRYQSFDGKHHLDQPKSTYFSYDAQGHLRFQIQADGTVTEYRYNEEGQCLSKRCYLGSAYDLTSTHKIEEQRLAAWVLKQNVQQVNLVDYCYDWRGQLTEEIYYNEINNQGLGVAQTAKRQRTSYDAAGRLTEKSTLTEKGWVSTYYWYDDLGRLLQIVDNQKNTQRFEYDDLHRRIIQTDANQLQTIQFFDRSGLLLSSTRLDNHQEYGAVQYQYDQAGRLIAKTNEQKLTHFFFYNAQGEIEAEVDIHGVLTQYAYNQEGDLIQTYQYATELNSQKWLDKIPLLNQIKPKSSPKDRITQNIYNDEGQLFYVVDSQGAVIEYCYNAQNKIISKTAYALKLDHFSPTDLLSYQQIVIKKSTNDRTIRYYYDVIDRLQAEVNAEGYATEYQYNHLNALIATRRFFNKTNHELRGNWIEDRPQAVFRDICTYSFYNNQGLKIADVDGKRYLVEYRYNQEGLLQEKIAYYNEISDEIKLEENNLTLEQIRPQKGDHDHHTLYRYNDLGQLVEESTQSGLITTYAYNEAGLLTLKECLDKKTHTSRQQQKRYDALGRVTHQLDELGCAKLKQPNLNSEQVEIIWQQHSIRYDYNQLGLISTKTNTLQQTTRYFYNDKAQLIYTVDPDGAVIETGFNAMDQLAYERKYSAYLTEPLSNLNVENIKEQLRLKKDTSDELTTYEFNNLGQLVAKEQGTSLLDWQYNSFGELAWQTQKISPMQQLVTHYNYDRLGLLTEKVEDPFGLNRKITNKYDAFGRLVKSLDAQNNATDYAYDKQGNQTDITQGNHNRFFFYDAFGRLTDDSHAFKRYLYDDINNTLTVIHHAKNSQVITEFNALGDKLVLIDMKQNRTSFFYDERGLLLRVEAPENHYQAYQYDEAGRLVWQEDAGQEIVYSYDAQDHILSKTIDPNGLNLNTCYQYDAIGRQLKIIENKIIKQFTYNNEGQVIKSCLDPEGLNVTTLYAYNASGLLVRQTELNPQGKNKITEYHWDLFGRKTATILDPDGLKITTFYEYDLNNNVICQIDANQHRIHFIYDEYNQCRYQINARGAVIEHVYNESGKEIRTIAYANCIAPLDEYTEKTLKAVLRPDAQDQYQFRFYYYNEMYRSYDAMGQMTCYYYDKNSNLIKKTASLELTPLEELKKGGTPLPPPGLVRIDFYAYDASNQLRFHTDDYGRLTEWQYDNKGQLTARIHYKNLISVHKTVDHDYAFFLDNLQPSAEDKKLTYVYDKAGRLSIEINAEGAVKSFEYNALSQIISSTSYALLANAKLLSDLHLSQIQKSPQDRCTYFVYDEAGREIYRINAEGGVIEHQYDSLGNVTSQIKHNRKVVPRSFPAAELKTILSQDKAARLESYQYDALGHMVVETNALKQNTRYEYDANGNLVKKTMPHQAVWLYHYNELNQLIETISPITKITTTKGVEERSISQQLQYDSFGNVICEIRDATGLKQTRLYSYDSKNRRIKTTYPNVNINQSSATASSQRQEITQTLIEEWQYNAYDELLASRNKAGHWQHYVYDYYGQLIFSVDSQGGLIEYHYDRFKRVQEKIHYAISANPKAYTVEEVALAKKTSAQDRHEFYTYNQLDQIVETTKDKIRAYNAATGRYITQQPKTRKSYNAFGEIIETAQLVNENDWNKTTYYFDKNGQQTATINAEGYLTVYQLDALGNIEKSIEYASRTPHWDPDQYQTPPSHSKDRIISYSYDLMGKLLSKTLEKITTSTFQKNQLNTEVRNLTTSYEYDALGNLTTTIDAQGNSSFCYYDNLGQLIATVGPKIQAGRTAVTYGYDALGNLVTTHHYAQGAKKADATSFQVVEDKNDQLTQAIYDVNGHLLTQTDAMGHALHYSYDANGNIARSFQTITKADKTTLIQDKRYYYDSENRLITTATIKEGKEYQEQAKYNLFGEVTAKGVNGQFNIHVDYDLLGRVWRSNTQGYYQIYLYDLADRLTQTLTANNGFHPEHNQMGLDLTAKFFDEELTGFNQSRWYSEMQRYDVVYDKTGHVLTQTKEYNLMTNNSPVTRVKQAQTVDRWGNMLSFTNALNFQTHYEYNEFNQVIKQELPETSFMSETGQVGRIKPTHYYYYDELGRVIALKDTNNNLFLKSYDALGNLITETDAKKNTRSKQYNLLEQLVSSKNERAAETHYRYDKNNRLLSIETKNTVNYYSYDELGQLIQQKNGMGDSVLLSYDVLGRQITHQDASGHISYYEYDDQGHKIKEIDPNKKQKTWVYDAAGRLKIYRDFANQETKYEYNNNGLLIHESSNLGKNIDYLYQGNGQLVEYANHSQDEVINYIYDAEDQLKEKEFGQGNGQKGWLNEKDSYEYDALGRLIRLRRYHQDDKSTNSAPGKGFLSVDYDYDKAGNIRHTKVSANYGGYQSVDSNDYYLYDANNRMTINKGLLINGIIVTTSNQGTLLEYDAVGNIKSVQKYEDGLLKKYFYSYNENNQLETIQKNENFNNSKSPTHKLQTKEYDKAGRVIAEHSFHQLGALVETNTILYINGLVREQKSFDERLKKETSHSHYAYDQVNNLTRWTTEKGGGVTNGGATSQHDYTYLAQDSYQQSTDRFTLSVYKSPTTVGQSTHFYNKQGQLESVYDSQSNSTISYWNSTLEGIKGRKEKNGDVHYLNVLGKTIGDLKLDLGKTQQLNIYGGFVQEKVHASGWGSLADRLKQQQELLNSFHLLSSNESLDALQTNLDGYVLQAGDSLKDVALQVYGDSSLWYLIADANGITSGDGKASDSGQLYIGQRLIIPPAAANQHHTHLTHKLLSLSQMLGNTSATAAIPSPPPPPPTHHHSLFAKIVVGIIATVTTVLTAGILGALAGAAANSLSSLFSLGTSVLAGGSMGSLSGTLAAGFTAGLAGNLAGQGARNALGLQRGLDFSSALISGLATAATAGLGQNLIPTNRFNQALSKLSLNNVFNATTASEMLQQNALSQGMNVAFRKHQHFDWAELAAATMTGGLLGSNTAQQWSKKINQLDPTGIIASELNVVVEAGAQTVATGTPFNATEAIKEHLGNAVGNGVVTLANNTEKYNDLFNDLSFSNHLQNMDEEFIQFLDFDANTPITTENHTHSKPGERMLGELSMIYETGRPPKDYLLASQTVSSGKDDPGGISYGAYQLASKTGTLQKFLNKNGAKWAEEFEGLDPKKPGAFGEKWKKIARRDGEDFFQAQHQFIHDTHYNSLLKKISTQTNLDISTLPHVMKDVIWSASVQHRSADVFVISAIKSLKESKDMKKYSYDLINSIYDKRIAYVKLQNLPAQIKKALITNRYHLERNLALEMLKKDFL